MTWLLDTNVLSEPTKRVPSTVAMGWVRSQDQTTLYTHSLALAEIQDGIDRSADLAWREMLKQWLELRVRPMFAGRVIETDEATWGTMLRIVTRARAARRTVPSFDLVFAASAERHGLIVVTRNVKDFAGTGVRVLNPWQPAPAIAVV